jgi:hypothetical protein
MPNQNIKTDFDSSSKQLYFYVSDTNSILLPFDRFLGFTEGALMTFYTGSTTNLETVIDLTVTDVNAMSFMKKLMDEINHGKKSVIQPETFFTECTDVNAITLQV